VLTGLLGAAVAAAATPGSAYADTTDPAGVPGAPASLTVDAAAGSLSVGWTPPATDGGTALTGYDVAAVPADPANGTTSVTAVTDAVTTAATLPGLTDGVAYTVTVAATNSSGSGPAATAVATPRTVPGAVVLAGVSAADHTATVTWAPPSSDGGAAVQYFAVTAHPSGRSVTAAAGATSASVSGLVDGAATTLSVAAVNAAGTGPDALSAAVTPRQPVRLAVAVAPARVVTYGAATHLTASLTDISGRGLAARRVVLSYRVGTGAYRTAGVGTTNSLGRIAYSVTLPATATLLLSHDPDALARVATSAGIVRVARKVTESAPRPILLGHAVVTTGAVSPRRAIGAPVYLQRLSAGRWVTVATGRMTTRASYRVAWKPGSAGVVSLRVLVPGDASYAAGAGRGWRQVVTNETVASVAADILRNTRITLATAHESGVSDGATAKGDVLALAAGRPAPRSAYQNAPGGSTPVDIRLLRALRTLGSKARVMVSEIAGGSHAVGSSHYRGEAMDITVVNGVSIAGGGSYSLVASVCRSAGASVVYDPAYDPYGGHGNHVHCQWGALSSD
jgi:hypothetical protein